jgi:hypothetical protein
MPTNKLIYFGVIVLAASVLLWIGAQIAKRAEWILPYAAGAGVLLIVIGLFMELKKKKEGAIKAETVTTPAETPGE